MAVVWAERLAGRLAGMKASEIRELLKVIERPEIISFAGGIPDPALFPHAEIAAAYQRVMESNALRSVALQYSVSEGWLPLREFICEMQNRGAKRGLGVSPDTVMITSGSQQGLEFIGKLLIGAGDLVAVTRPTYLGALQAFAPYEPRYLSVPVDDEGVLPDALEDAFRQGPKFFYLVPDFQNPNGITTSLARRRAVIDLAARYGVPVIEDAAYTELRYDGEALPSLLTLDAEHAGPGAGFRPGHVLYAGTFSKTVAPALRVGWLTGPEEVIHKLVLMKQAADLHSSTINQIVLTEVVREIWPELTARLRAAYRVRRDAMLAALERWFPPGTRWTRPAGGLFVWLELPEGIDGTTLLERAIREVNVAFVPGAAFHADRSGANTCRLSFSMVGPGTIDEGIRRLSTLLPPSP
ncbi:MAG: PLP-dependent aminotransferase family protein [Rhodospirillaceae bacterium]